MTKTLFRTAAIACLLGIGLAPAIAEDKPCGMAFADVDKNGDGAIGNDEATDALKAAWDQVDTDKDGKVSTAEYDVCAKS